MNEIIKPGQIVRVYYNLHKHLFSVKDKKSGIVIAYMKDITIGYPKFLVYEKGRDRVRRDKMKNVHAYVDGVYLGMSNFICGKFSEAYYNPYKNDYFIDKDSGKKLIDAEIAHLKDKRIFYIN